MLDQAGELIGRQVELAELTAALDDLQGGRGGLFLLTGDAGIGKTRLLEAVADAAEPTDAAVLWGRSWEGGGAPAYWPWSQVLRAVLRDLDPSASQGYPPAVMRYVSELVPELAGGDGLARGSSATDIPGAREALFDAVATLIRVESAERPLVLAFEDLHAADEASLRLLQFAARQLRSSPVLILGTYRDAEVRSAPAVHALLSAIGRQGRLITLSGLDEVGVKQLLEHTTKGVRLAADARAVHETTEGNPFFVQEVARLLLTERQLARDLAGSGRVPVPEEVHDLIRRRLHPLPPEAHEALQLASVLGRDFEIGVLSVVAGRSPDELLDILDVGAELAVVQNRGLGRWRFSHALLREALYDELDHRQRVVLHRRAGEAIEECAGEDPAGRAPQLAYHFFEAAGAGDGARAVQYCSMAARQAMAAMAFEEAAVLNGRALDALALSRVVDEGLRYELLMALAQAQHRAGDFPLARETFQRAVTSARSLGSPERLARAAIAYTGFSEARADHTRATVLEEALAVLPAGDSPLRARILVLLAHRVKYTPTASPEASAKSWQRGWQLATQGIEMARRVAGPDDRWAVLWDWHASASLHHDTLHERFGVVDELVEMASAAGDPERLVLARQRRAADYFTAGDVGAAAVELDVARREADALRMPFLLWGVAMMQASVALFRGELDEGQRFAREALRFGERAENADVERAFAWQRGELYLHRGQFAEFDRHTRERRDRLGVPLGASNCAWLIVGRAAFLAGKPEEAATNYRHMLPIFTPELFVRAQLCCPTQLVQLAWLIETDEGLDRVWDILLRHAGTHVTAGVGHSSAGACDRYLAQISALQGRFDDAEEFFQHAYRLNTRMGTPLWAAYTLSDHAQMLVRRGRAQDRSRARQLAEAAAGRFARLGMHFWEGRARGLVGGEDASVTTAVPESARLIQEGEDWVFHYQGAVARLRDSKGLRYLALLLRSPGQELRAVDLAAASDAERARQSVTRAIKGAIERVGAAHPSLGEHLRSTVHVGVLSAYVPDSRTSITWES
jgi:tetratricopeptide (TPR) repeat protein